MPMWHRRAALGGEGPWVLVFRFRRFRAMTAIPAIYRRFRLSPTPPHVSHRIPEDPSLAWVSKGFALASS